MKSIEEAQAEFRSVFLGGSIGQFVTGFIWLVSAAAGMWGSKGAGILFLFLGGILIYPLTQLFLRLLGRGGAISPHNPFGKYFLHSVIAMGVTYPLVYAATLYDINWFYPAFMLATGAHYLSFILFYGMNQFGILAGILIGSAILIVMLLPGNFSAGGWLTGIILVLFAITVWRTVVTRLSKPAAS
jgi:hypothetical protein